MIKLQPQREDHQRSLRPIEASSGSTARSAKETAAGILVEQEESNRDDSSQHGYTATQLVSIQHPYKSEDPGTSTEKIGSSFSVQEYTLMDADTASSIPIGEVSHSTNGIDSHSSSQSCSPSQVGCRHMSPYNMVQKWVACVWGVVLTFKKL